MAAAGAREGAGASFSVAAALPATSVFPSPTGHGSTSKGSRLLVSPRGGGKGASLMSLLLLPFRTCATSALFFASLLLLPAALFVQRHYLLHPSTAHYQILVDDLYSWLHQYGVNTSACKLLLLDSSARPWNNYRPDVSMAAARNVSEGEVVLQLPRSVLVHSWRVLPLDGPLYSNATREHDWLYPSTALAAWLLRERAALRSGEASDWGPYVRLLPSRVALPATFDEELIKEFQIPELVNLALQQRRDFLAEYEACRPAAIGSASADDFLHAMAAVRSRMFGGEEDEALQRVAGTSHAPTALLPLGDFCMHAQDPSLHFENGEEGSVRFKARRALKQGEELTISYSPGTNDLLLLTFGFSLGSLGEDNVLLMLGFFANASEVVYQRFLQPRAGEASAEGLPPAGGASGGGLAVDEEKRAGAWSASLKANRAVVRLLPREKQNRTGLTGFMFALDLLEPRVWKGGFVDPRLLASLTATVYFLRQNKEPKYSKLARLSMRYAWALERGSCRDIAKALALEDEEVEAFVVAAGGVRAVAEDLLNSLPTSLVKDEAILRALPVCRKVDEANVEVEGEDGLVAIEDYCASLKFRGLQYLEELQHVVGVRIEKKKILWDLVRRLKTTCV